MIHLIYFSIIAFVWVGIWGCGFWYFHARGRQRPLFQRQGGQLIFFGAAVAIPFLYCPGYAPFLRFLAWAPSMQLLDDLFVPVQWLFDHTELRAPLLKWAAAWHVDQDTLLTASANRMRSSWGPTVP